MGAFSLMHLVDQNDQHPPSD